MCRSWPHVFTCYGVHSWHSAVVLGRVCVERGMVLSSAWPPACPRHQSRCAALDSRISYPRRAISVRHGLQKGFRTWCVIHSTGRVQRPSAESVQCYLPAATTSLKHVVKLDHAQSKLSVGVRLLVVAVFSHRRGWAPRVGGMPHAFAEQVSATQPQSSGVLARACSRLTPKSLERP